MKCVSALSTAPQSPDAVREVLDQLDRRLDGERAHLAVVFATPHHAEHLVDLSRRLRGSGKVERMIGCTAEAIIGDAQEVEGSAGLSVWAGSLPGFQIEAGALAFDDGEFRGIPDSLKSAGPGTLGLILLGDPFSFPIDAFLKRIGESAPGVPVIGGMASGSRTPGGNALLIDDSISDSGAVAVSLRGPHGFRTVVSQGCRPVGRSMIVTRAERNVIRELGRRPALTVLQEVYDELIPNDQLLIQRGLHVGRVINEYQEAFHRGDFLVRNVLGVDEHEGLAISDLIRVGQTVQFHVRDAESAHEDLLALLEAEKSATRDALVQGALIFSCNGRGLNLFPGPNHDVSVVRRVLGPIATAGFFAMGEIGPIGGQNFVHGFTASIALFTESIRNT